MAIPRILQAMWLLLASAASAGLDTRSVQREFPQLAHVIYSICGLADLDISISHPCAFSIFGMAYAFTECGVVHHDDYQNFQPCILSCTTDDRCARACADPEVRNDNCLANCQVVAKCIKEVATHPKIKGHVSAKDQLKRCFAEEPKAPPPPALILPSSPAQAFASSPATVLLATQSARAPAPAVASMSPAASPSAASDTFSMRKGTLSQGRDLVASDCVCSKTGIIRGTDTGQPGCGKHGKERNAFVEAYCYVEGGFKCGGSMASDVYTGLFWVGCEKPNLHVLYPPTCEILERSEAKLFPVPMDLGLKAPPASYEDMQADMAAVPTEGNPMKAMGRDMKTWTQPLPPLWHATRDNYFSEGAFQSGPTLAVFSPPAGMAPAPAAALIRLRGVRQH